MWKDRGGWPVFEVFVWHQCWILSAISPEIQEWSHKSRSRINNLYLLTRLIDACETLWWSAFTLSETAAAYAAGLVFLVPAIQCYCIHRTFQMQKKTEVRLLFWEVENLLQLSVVVSLSSDTTIRSFWIHNCAVLSPNRGWIIRLSCMSIKISK